MPADIQLSGMEVSLVNAMSRETILRQYLDTVKGQYSHMGLSSALNTSLRWLEHGDVLRSYEIIKVQGAGEKLRDTVGEVQNPRNLPLIKHVEKRGGIFTPPLFEKVQK